MWSFVTEAQGKGIQASFHQVAESKPPRRPGNLINSLFLGPGLSARAVRWCLRVGTVGGHPALEHLPLWSVSSESPCPLGLLLVILSLAGHQSPSTRVLSAASSSLLTLGYCFLLSGPLGSPGDGGESGTVKAHHHLPAVTSLCHATAPSPL